MSHETFGLPDELELDELDELVELDMPEELDELLELDMPEELDELLELNPPEELDELLGFKRPELELEDELLLDGLSLPEEGPELQP